MLVVLSACATLTPEQQAARAQHFQDMKFCNGECNREVPLGYTWTLGKVRCGEVVDLTEDGIKEFRLCECQCLVTPKGRP